MRKLGLVVAILLALAAAGAWLAYNYIDVAVKLALERYGPDVTGVEVNVGEVRISPRDGRGAIRGLDIGNPPGFTAPRAARLGEIRVALDPGTITDPVVRVRELALESPHVTYERGAKSTNLDVIQNHIEAYVKRGGGEAGRPGKAAADDRRRFVIDRLTIRGARVLMTNSGLRGQGLSFDLPDVELRDIGKDRGGVTAGEVSRIVARELQARIAQKVLTNIDALRKGGVEGAIDALKGLLR